MKKTISILTLLLSISMFSQTENSSLERKNDIMINPIFLVLGIGNVSYERILSENSGIGANALFVIDNYVVDSSGSGFQLAPYYHYYFGKKTASGFFIGGFASISSSDVEKEYFDTQSGYSYTTSKETAFGLGFKFGGKWILKNNLLFEVSTGIGRNFTSDVDNKIISTGMLGIGYRF